MTDVPSATIEQLREIPLFRDLPEGPLKNLAPGLFIRSFRTGETILREGEYCDGAYYLIDGLVEVRFSSTGDAGQAEGAGQAALDRPPVAGVPPR